MVRCLQGKKEVSKYQGFTSNKTDMIYSDGYMNLSPEIYINITAVLFKMLYHYISVYSSIRKSIFLGGMTTILTTEKFLKKSKWPFKLKSRQSDKAIGPHE